jgi:hypothetical protein
MTETDIGVCFPAARGTFVYITALIKILGEAAITTKPGGIRPWYHPHSPDEAAF